MTPLRYTGTDDCLNLLPHPHNKNQWQPCPTFHYHSYSCLFPTAKFHLLSQEMQEFLVADGASGEHPFILLPPSFFLYNLILSGSWCWIKSHTLSVLGSRLSCRSLESQVIIQWATLALNRVSPSTAWLLQTPDIEGLVRKRSDKAWYVQIYRS